MDEPDEDLQLLARHSVVPGLNRFEGEISAVGADDLDVLRRAVAAALQAHGVSAEWGELTAEKGIFEKKDILAFAFNLAISLAVGVAADAIYDAIKAERPAATLTTDASGACTITLGKSSIYLSPSLQPPSLQPTAPAAPDNP